MCETIQTYFIIPKGSLPFDTSLSDLVSKVYIFKAISAKVSWFPVVCFAHWNILLIFQWRKPRPSETLIEVDEITYLVAAMEFPPGRIILWINQLLSFHGISDFSIHISLEHPDRLSNDMYIGSCLKFIPLTLFPTNIITKHSSSTHIKFLQISYNWIWTFWNWVRTGVC